MGGFPATEQPRYRPISDYGIIGDCESAALVSSDGSIDWWCPRRFDGASAFAAILDRRRGGFFHVHAGERAASSNAYVGRSNVLRTTFRSSRGVAELTDFMPVPPLAERMDVTRPRLYRTFRVTEGEMDVEWTFAPRFDYGRVLPRFRLVEPNVVEATGAGVTLTLAAARPLSVGAGGVYGSASVTAGEEVTFAIGYTPFTGSARRAGAGDVHAALDRTLAFWKGWTANMRYKGPYEEQVARSALVLKMLTYRPTGAVLAAPTTSIPEWIGGVRNWDYRFSWVRDAAFTVRALHAIGHEEEAERYVDWLLDVAGDDPADLRVLYGITGNRDPTERTLDHLDGYRDSRPVRAGNAAATQFQLDVYGELMVCMGDCQALGLHAEDRRWSYFRRLADFVAANWRRPDSGIWEVRSEPKHFVLSKAMAWAALDHAVSAAEGQGLPGDVDRWRKEAEACHAEIMERGYSEEMGAFRQAYDEDAVDAANLLLPLIGFVDAKDPRMVGTVDRIMDVLTVNKLVYRYLGTEDGLPGHEATFAYCTFWLVEVLALQDRVEEARHVFENLLAHASPLGLISEEVDPVNGELLGNYPQGFPHIGLITAAVRLQQAEERKATRA